MSDKPNTIISVATSQVVKDIAAFISICLFVAFVIRVAIVAM